MQGHQTSKSPREAVRDDIGWEDSKEGKARIG